MINRWKSGAQRLKVLPTQAVRRTGSFAAVFQPGRPAHRSWVGKEQRAWFAKVIASTAGNERLQDLVLDECAQKFPAPVEPEGQLSA